MGGREPAQGCHFLHRNGARMMPFDMLDYGRQFPEMAFVFSGLPLTVRRAPVDATAMDPTSVAPKTAALLFAKRHRSSGGSGVPQRIGSRIGPGLGGGLGGTGSKSGQRERDEAEGPAGIFLGFILTQDWAVG